MPVELVTVRSAQLESSAWMDLPINVNRDISVQMISRTLFEDDDEYF